MLILKKAWQFPGGPVVRTFTAKGVQSLVGEVRSSSHVVPPKTKTKTKQTQSRFPSFKKKKRRHKNGFQI